MFVTFEGLDGCGKSTQARLLAERLRVLGREVVECREPGATALGERVRGLVLDHGGWAIGARAEALLFAASRAQLVEEVVRPALARGACVVCDRFLDSSVAYQGGGRGLGLEAVRALSLFAIDGVLPDRTVILAGTVSAIGAPDRIESEDDGFRARVGAAYAELAAAEPARIRVVDAQGAVADVAARVREAVGA